MKDPNYVMKIMERWMTLDELDFSRTRRYSIDRSGTKGTKHFTYRQTFEIHFRYIHQMNNHNNWIHATIYLERTWVTKFWPDRNFAWYLLVLEVNSYLTPGHFQNDGVVKPSLDFWRALEIEFLYNKNGV